MRLLLDEDSQSHMLTRLLREGSHEFETVTEAGIAGSLDAAVLAHAKRADRVLLIRNGRDFLLLHQADNKHAGILIEHEDTAPSKNMTYGKIVAAITRIEASGWDIRNTVISIHVWR